LSSLYKFTGEWNTPEELTGQNSVANFISVNEKSKYLLI